MKIFIFLLLIAPTLVVADTTIEIGQGWASGDPGNAVVIIGERNDKYGASIGLIERHYIQADGERHTLDRNMFVDVQRFWKYKRFEFGLGPAYFQNTNRALTKKLNWSVLIRFKLNEDVSIVARHWSNAGTGYYNMGHDFIGIGFRF